MVAFVNPFEIQLYACFDRAVAAGVPQPLSYSAAGVAYCSIDVSIPGVYQASLLLLKVWNFILYGLSGSLVPACRSYTQLAMEMLQQKR